MNKTGKIAILMAMVALLPFSSPCWGGQSQAGRFATALTNKFCGGTSGASRYGCYGYMFYRVDLNKNKDSARSICIKTGCDGTYGKSDPSKLPACYAGCEKAYSADN